MNDPAPLSIEVVHLDLFGTAFPPFATGTLQFAVVGPHVVVFGPGVHAWQRETAVERLALAQRAADAAAGAGPETWHAAYAAALSADGLLQPASWTTWHAGSPTPAEVPVDAMLAWAFGEGSDDASAASSALAVLRSRRDDPELMGALGEGLQPASARYLVSVVRSAAARLEIATLSVVVDGTVTLGALLDGHLPDGAVRVAHHRTHARLERTSAAMPPAAPAGRGLSPAPSGASADEVLGVEAGAQEGGAASVDAGIGGGFEIAGAPIDWGEPTDRTEPAAAAPPAPSAAERAVKAAVDEAPPGGRGATPHGTERVDAAVYGPTAVAPASVFLVQVFLHPVGAEATAAAQARQADDTAQLRGRRSLDLTLAPDTRVDIRLEVPGLIVEEPDAVLIWRRDVASVQFEVSVPATFAPSSVVARVRFAVGGIPVGTLRFTLKVTPDAASIPAPAVHEVNAARYRRAFVSYSSRDRAEVLKRVQAFKIAGMSVFQDVLDLDPGERWERALYREIDTCDVFLLFWSSSAADSTWVLKEIDYALQRKGGDEEHPPAIQPVPIEGPPIPKPPVGLGGLHFNDALLAHIAAAAPRPPATTG